MRKIEKIIIVLIIFLAVIVIMPKKIAANDNGPKSGDVQGLGLKTNVNGYDIGAYLSNGIYYIFLPNSVNISNLNIVYLYNSDIKQISSGSYDSINNVITNDFSDDDTLTITFNDNKTAIVKVMQSDIPSVCINLKNNVTLNNVNNGSKDLKYQATFQIIGALDNNYNISDDNIEFKGRGNTTWHMDKKGYQIKLNKKQNLLGIRKWKIKKVGIIS